VPSHANVVLSVHCHDDLGLGVANSLAALEAGARQVECTINGIGERAGNSALEEIVMAIRTHGRALGLWTGIDTRLLYATSRLVSRTTGSDVQANKAVVGDNAFSHEAGIHQHGVIANPETYEIMRPGDVGFPESRLVLGKHSGRHALRWRYAELGIELDDQDLEATFSAFKALADERKHVRDADLERIAGRSPPRAWKLEELELTTRVGRAATATVTLVHRDGNRVREVAVADQPLSALLRAFDRATGVALAPLHCRVRRMPCDEETATELVLTVAHDGAEQASAGTGGDFAEAVGNAILEIVNRIERRRAQEQSAQAIA
jgi:2-isopropylmalate synthase